MGGRNKSLDQLQMALTAEQIEDAVYDLIASGAIDEDRIVNNPDYTIMWGDTPNNSNPEGADHARLGDQDLNLINDPYMPDIENMEHMYSNDVYLHGRGANE